jgi:DNA invertase Pin-like site-specific DNA recombinase
LLFTLHLRSGTRAKKFARLLSAVGALGEDLHGQGIINLEKVRYTISARKEESKRLIKAGKSYREAAEELGVSKQQILRDLSDDGKGHVTKRDNNGTKSDATLPVLVQPK